MMDGFVELESLHSLQSRLSETATWHEVFQQYALQAVRLDAEGNRSGAEILYHQCKVYLEQATFLDQGVAGPLCLGFALCWVYLALANLYRYSFRDYWKSIECLRLLLSTRTKIASSSEGLVVPTLNEIRFALCLTMFEWIDESVGRESTAASEEALAVLLEEVRGILDEMKGLNDVQVKVSLADTLSRGYARLTKHEWESFHWKQRSLDWKKEFPGIFRTTGDLFLDSLSQSSCKEFGDSIPQKVEICLSKFKEFGVKAKTATAAGDIFAAIEYYMQCEAAVTEANDELFASKRALLLLWVYYGLGHVYRFDMEDGLSKGIDYYLRCLEILQQIKADKDQLDLNFNFVRFIGVASESISSRLEDLIHKSDVSDAFGTDKQLDTRISLILMTLAEMVFEAEYPVDDVSLDEETQSRRVAEAVRRTRGLLPHLFDTECSDWFVKDFMCDIISTTYENCGRVWKALFWNEVRLKLYDKEYRSTSEMELVIPARKFFALLGDMPRFYIGEHLFSFGMGDMNNRRMDLCLRSASLRSVLGEHEKAENTYSKYTRELKGVFRKREPTETARLTSLSYLPSASSSRRSQQYLRHFRENPESNLPSMSIAAIEAERADETKWGEDYLKCGPTSDVGYKVQRASMNMDDLGSKASQLWVEGKTMEAVARYKEYVEKFSEVEAGGSMDSMFYRIGMCHFQLMVRERGAGEYSDVFHFDEALKYFRKALNEAERIADVYRMADYNKVLGCLYSNKWIHGLCKLVKVSVDGLECLLQAVDFFKASGRYFCRYLHALRKDPDELWVSVLETQYDSESINLTTSVFSLIICSLWDAYRLERRLTSEKLQVATETELNNLQNQFLEKQMIWFIEALLWAERGHSRTLAFKLSERNQGKSTRLELQKFDLGSSNEAWPRIFESREACGPGTVMVEFVMAPENHPQAGAKFFVFCLTQNRHTSGWSLEFKPRDQDLGILLDKLNNHMKMNSGLPQNELFQIVEDLYDAFFSPLQNILDTMEEHHTLVVCANKILAGVPFAALRNPKTGKFLIERHTVVCTPSLRILKQCDNRLKALQRTPLMEGTGAALVLGDAAFSKAKDRLEATEAEADTIAGILGHQNVHLLKGTEASKVEVLKWAQLATSEKYQAVMHLATHGRVNPSLRAFKEGALEFADPKVKTWPPESTGLSQSRYDMTSSLGAGLQISESHVSRVDGASSSTSVQPFPAQEPTSHDRGQQTSNAIDSRHLTSGEIVKHYEWRMLLAVLSACDTAKGEVKSEGTFNLARALLISGVPSTVVSLWKVDDDSAPVLMEGLYKAMMSGGMDVASALREAMRAMIRDGYHIRQWAPFVIMGLGTVKLPKQFREGQVHETKE